ncbi:MAG: helix-turn-helix transcriptional regulator [Erysipelotrichaceae bacterium]|nr:helix-turn-helix transcriptional regulator [Erysipelotrichaceae bacterium]
MMRNEEIKTNFANNIKELREKKNMTQQELGNALGYSDKSISKWEKGDVLPDVVTLDFVANYFSLTVNDLINSNGTVSYGKYKKINTIIWGSLFLVIFLANLVFFFLNYIANVDRAWLSFVFALPCFFTVVLILNAIFYDYKAILVSTSLLTWSLALCFFLGYLSYNFWYLFVISFCLQIFYIFIGLIVKVFQKRKRN